MSRHVVAGLGLLALLALSVGSPRAGGQKADIKNTDSALPSRVSLGVAVEEMPNEGPHGGVIVRHITPESPAARAGVKAGDIIVRAANRQVDDFDELVNVLAGHRPGDKVTLTVLRDREPTRLKVTLGEPGKGGGKPPDGARTCAFLGVLTTPIEAMPEEMAERLGLEDEEGLVVVNVVPGSPAARAGLHHGDILVTVDGKDIEDPDALRTHVHRAGVGKEVTLKVRRGENEREVRATLAEGPCDVSLMSPRGRAGGNGDPTVRRLERRIEVLEKRLEQLEGKRGSDPRNNKR